MHRPPPPGLSTFLSTDSPTRMQTRTASLHHPLGSSRGRATPAQWFSRSWAGANPTTCSCPLLREKSLQGPRPLGPGPFPPNIQQAALKSQKQGVCSEDPSLYSQGHTSQHPSLPGLRGACLGLQAHGPSMGRLRPQDRTLSRPISGFVHCAGTPRVPTSSTCTHRRDVLGVGVFCPGGRGVAWAQIPALL